MPFFVVDAFFFFLSVWMPGHIADLIGREQ